MDFSNKLKLCAPKPARTQSPKPLAANSKTSNFSKLQTREDILSELNVLSSFDIFFNVLIKLVATNLNSYVDELGTRDFRALLNQNELAFLFGLWLKNRHRKINATIGVDGLAIKVHKLMDDLHHTFIKRPSKPFEQTSYSELFITSLNLQETIFYAGTGAYDYQFLDFLKAKYKYDKDWIKTKTQVELKYFIEFYVCLKSIVNYKLNFKGLSRTSLEIYSIDKNCYLFKKFPEFLKILDTFSIKDDEVLNIEFNDIGDLNAFALKPILDTNNKFIFPFPYLVAEAFYESPFYWMLQDTSYKTTALSNRGKCAEEIVTQELLKIFPKEAVFNNVFVTLNKTKRLTDIDVCVFYEETLLIFQVKSKKLTQLSKKGNLDQIKLDFSQAVEDSFNQAQKVYEPIKTNKCRLVNEQGNEVIRTDTIKNIYSICVVLDNYTTVLIHSRIFYNEREEVPIAMTIFDLQVLIKYLRLPQVFINYVDRRTKTAKTIVTDTELSYLKYFMTHGLQMPKDSDMLMLESDFAQFFDKDYYMQLIKQYESKFPSFIKDIGRNDGCFCGSGKKFKNCCNN